MLNKKKWMALAVVFGVFVHAAVESAAVSDKNVHMVVHQDIRQLATPVPRVPDADEVFSQAIGTDLFGGTYVDQNKTRWTLCVMVTDMEQAKKRLGNTNPYPYYDWYLTSCRYSLGDRQRVFDVLEQNKDELQMVYCAWLYEEEKLHIVLHRTSNKTLEDLVKLTGITDIDLDLIDLTTVVHKVPRNTSASGDSTPASAALSASAVEHTDVPVEHQHRFCLYDNQTKTDEWGNIYENLPTKEPAHISATAASFGTKVHTEESKFQADLLALKNHLQENVPINRRGEIRATASEIVIKYVNLEETKAYVKKALLNYRGTRTPIKYQKNTFTYRQWDNIIKEITQLPSTDGGERLYHVGKQWENDYILVKTLAAYPEVKQDIIDLGYGKYVKIQETSIRVPQNTVGG